MNDAAVGLGVAELELSDLLQGRTSALRTESLVAVLTGVVRHFGVDPSWLVTGRYDVQSHLAAEDNRADLISIRFQIHRLLSGPDWSIPMEPVKRADRIAPEMDGLDGTEGSASTDDPKAERDDGRRSHGGEPDR